MIYICAISVVSLLLYLIYLNMPFWSFILSLSPLPLIYLARKKSFDTISQSIAVNQIFLCAIIPVILLKWNDLTRSEVYVVSLVASSYMKFLFLIFKAKILLLLSWIPVCYVVYDLLNLRFENKFYGLLGIVFVLLIAFRDLSTVEKKRKL